MSGTVVVKLGGSLLDWPALPRRLPAYFQWAGHSRVVLVVGGGPTVDVLRSLDAIHSIGESRSHDLALRALDLTGAVVEALVAGHTLVDRPGLLGGVWESGRIPILTPRHFMRIVDRAAPDPLPECWSVTSDSIAARLATHLDADGLVLLKSTSPNGPLNLHSAAHVGLVDSFFPVAARRLASVRILNLRDVPFVYHELNDAESSKPRE